MDLSCPHRVLEAITPSSETSTSLPLTTRVLALLMALCGPALRGFTASSGGACVSPESPLVLMLGWAQH